ncbi:MAG: hypothetical protein DRN53_02225 [Thermoprotei archaeon]|nr:MAG: hypothetical protein DRN53_02225 [Thermoprotei archaeon]
MESLNKLERYILAYLWYEYGGALYFSKGKESAEKFLAKMLTNELISERPYYYKTVVDGFVDALKRLQEYWMIQLSGYEITLTSYGQQLAKQIEKNEYTQLKSDIAKGKLR